jgi:lipid II:glycine glycyltransferase (peptidoglycan interpeptide bridge formation enzyme)
MPFSDFCAPLVFDGWGQESLMERLLELGRERKWRYFELRGGRETLPAPAAAEKYYSHKLDLTIGIEELFVRFQSPVRRAIRKAEKSGLTVEASKTREAMLDFYRLHVCTRRRHGLPPQSLTFFLNIHEAIIKTGLGFIVLAQRETKPIAAAVFLHSGATALYKYGASDEGVQELRGNNLVMWEGIKRLTGKGLKTLHFGRTSVDNDGLRKFKLSWGTKEEIIEYFRFAFGPNMWVNSYCNASQFHNRLFRRLPLAVNRVAGTLIYPHLD